MVELLYFFVMEALSNYDYNSLMRKNRLAGTATELSPEIASTLGALFGSYLGGEEAVVVSARDFRKDTRMISRSFNAGLISVGTTVFELHACSLPVLQFALRRFSAHAGVHFASAHRSPEKINIRIFDQTGVELPFTEIFEKEKLQKRKIIRSAPDKIADILSVHQANDLYRSAIRSAMPYDVLKEKNFSIVVDCSLGPVAEIFPNIMAELGSKIFTLNSYRPDGIPESLPSPISLTILSRTVVAAKADLGIAFDPSGSRVIFMDEHGKIIDSHVIATILLKNKMIGREKGHVVLAETMWVLEKWLNEKNISHTFTRGSPGEMSRLIQFKRALFGANEHGSYIHPTFSNESEPFVSTLLLLWSFAQNEKHKYISSFAEENDVVDENMYLEEYYRLNADPTLFFKKIYETDTDGRVVNTLDGVKIVSGARKWAHIYASIISTTLIVKVCAENKEDREKLLIEILDLVRRIDNEVSTN